MKMNRVLVLAFLIITTVLTSNYVYAAGKPAPQFQLPGLDGKIYSLSDFFGHPVLVTFFTTQCGFCAEELPLLNNIYHTYQLSAGLQIIAINLGENENAIRKMLIDIPYDYLTLLDKDTQLAGSYQIFGVPTTYFIDPKGNIVDFIIGATNKETIMKKLGRIMWYRGLRNIEIENLLVISPRIEVLDFRSGGENPYSDKINVNYIPVSDLNQTMSSLDPNQVYLVLTDSNESSLNICQQLALNDFQKVYYKIDDGN